MKVCLALFSYGGVHPRTVRSLVQELALFQQMGIQCIFGNTHGDALISRSRSKALSSFLDETDADVFFMLDHDIEFAQGDILATCDKALELEAPVAGFYSVRARNVGYSGKMETKDPVFIGGPTAHTAKYLPGGFTAIPLETARKVKALNPIKCKYLDGKTTFTPFFMPLVVDGEYLSEDWAFSERVRLAGIPQYLFEKPRLTHWGDYGYTLEEAAR